MSRKKKALLMIIILFLGGVAIKIQFFPFGYAAPRLAKDTIRLEAYAVAENIPNTSIFSYRVDMKIRNQEEFVAYLQANAVQYQPYTYTDVPQYELGSFMDSNGAVNWEVVLEAVEVRRLGWKTIYSLEYRTLNPACNGYRLDMTHDGYIRDYRSAGV